MNTRNQVILDKYIAKPAAYVLNFFVRLAGQLFRIDHNLNRNFKVIAVCKFKGMGSILQATPMLAALRKKFPDAEIIFVSTKSNKAILDKIELVNTKVLVDESSLAKFIISNIKALVFLIRKRPGIYIDLEIYSDFSTLFATFTFSKNRIGFYLRSSSFRMGIYTHMMFFNPRVAVSKVYLQIASLIGCDEEEYPLYPLGIKTNKQESAAAKPYIVINPNASDLRLERRWHRDNFIALMQHIRQSFSNHDIKLVGSRQEKEYTDSITTQLNDTCITSTAGLTNIDELTALIKNASLMISNDTGPMHIAFCTGTPVICLFGPCSPEQYGVSINSHIIYKKVYCSPCVHEFEIPPCHGNNVCMKLITVEEVFEKVKSVLSSNEKEIKAADSFVYSLDKQTIGLVGR